MAKCLITGGGGFIGSNMIGFLKKRGHYVRIIDKQFPDMRADLFREADEIIAGDLRNIDTAILALNDSEWVFHFAADMGGVGYFYDKDFHPYLGNMQIDINVLRAAEFQQIERMYYASSACIYPISRMNKKQIPIFKETDIFPADPDQYYGWQKLQTTLLCGKAPFDARVGIQHTIYGPYQEIEGPRMKFPTAIATKVIDSKKTGKPIEIWGDGEQIRTFEYIDDCLEKIYLVMTEDYHGPVNIGSDINQSVVEIADLCCTIVNTPRNYKFNLDMPRGAMSRGCDNTLFEKLYKYKSLDTVDVGFKKMIEWIQYQ